MTLDMDRSILSVRSGPKPHFIVNGEGLKLIGLPLTTNHHQYFSENAPEIPSYLYRLMSRQLNSLPLNHDVTMCNTERHQAKVQINQHLISEFAGVVKGTGFPYMFLIFNPQNEGLKNDDDWRDQLLHQTFAAENVPYISSKIVIREHAQLHNKDSFSEYYFQNNSHPTPFKIF